MLFVPIFTFTVTTNQHGDWDNRPVVQLLPERVTGIELLEGKELQPVIMDDFILIKFNEGVLPMKGNRGGTIPIKGDFTKGEKYTVKFRAQRA